ncbi:MAG: alpha-1,2-fucosyltransferase [Bryobacteraceae bacterium]|nr:alpha-1,2-fucosyltransferase [Bryobacteraceae bacterium]
MLSTRWWQLVVGPALRRERDWRTYHNLFVRASDDIRGLTKWRIERSAARLPEPEDLEVPAPGGKDDQLVVFKGMGKGFVKLNGHHQLLRREIEAITHPRWLEQVRRAGDGMPQAVALHIRRGDFAIPRTPEEMITRGGVQTPLSWFIDSLALVRRRAGWRVPAFVFSDAPPAELEPLLASGEVRIAHTGSAIADILLMSTARLLIGSGGSTFSGWAAFLGQMPVVTHVGQNLNWYHLEPVSGQFIGTLDPAQPDPLFIDQVDALLRARSASS